MRSLAKAGRNSSLFASKFFSDRRASVLSLHCLLITHVREKATPGGLIVSLQFAFSRTTSLEFLSSLIPRKTACRNRSSRVHSVNLTWQTIDGFTQRQRFISAAVRRTASGCIPARLSLANQMNLYGRYIPGCRLSYQKSIMILGYPVKAEKRSWSLSRQTK